MIIVGVVGALDLDIQDDRVWKYLKEAFLKSFPEARFVTEHTFYTPWNISKLKKFGAHLLEKYDTGEDVLFVGFSLGGVLAAGIADRFQKSTVRMVVTINSPHQTFYQKLLSGKKGHPSEAPTISFGGFFDFFVPFFLTRYPHALKHEILKNDHLFSYMISDVSAVHIAHEARRFCI